MLGTYIKYQTYTFSEFFDILIDTVSAHKLKTSLNYMRYKYEILTYNTFEVFWNLKLVNKARLNAVFLLFPHEK